MRLRTFTAKSMPAALAMVKAELGDDAIILSSEEKKDGVHVTAAVDPDAEAPAPAAKPQQTAAQHHNIDQLRYDVQHQMRFHNLPELYISRMVASLNDATAASILGKARMNIANESRHFLKLALEHIAGKVFSFAPLPEGPHKLMLVGSPGIGKTLAIAKLATQYTLAGRKAVVVTTDVNRAGGIDQLKSFTDILGVPLSVCSDKKSLETTLKLAARDTSVLVDSAGCNPYAEHEIAELLSYTAIPGLETALVMPSGMDPQEAIDVAEIFMELPVSYLIATRTDCTRRFGGLLAVALAYKLPFCLGSGSSSVADNIAELDAKTLVQYLLKP